jgi:DNA topoisomerase II
MRPWYRGYSGVIEPKEDGTSYLIKGRYEIDSKKGILRIYELPIMVWTRNYKNHLEDLAQKNIVDDIREFHKDNSIHFEL